MNLSETLKFFTKLPLVVKQALEFAENAHQGQLRKDGKTPYIMHPIGCLSIAIDSPWHFSDEELAALCLHDVLEDTKATFERIYGLFGADIAGIVYLLSKPDSENFRRKIYMASLRRVAPSVIALKLIDMLHNLIDLPKTAIIYEKYTDPAQGVRREQEDFDEYFRAKVTEDAPMLIGVLRMHGDVWSNYANWIETRIRRELEKGLVVTE